MAPPSDPAKPAPAQLGAGDPVQRWGHLTLQGNLAFEHGEDFKARQCYSEALAVAEELMLAAARSHDARAALYAPALFGIACNNVIELARRQEDHLTAGIFQCKLAAGFLSIMESDEAPLALRARCLMHSRIASVALCRYFEERGMWDAAETHTARANAAFFAVQRLESIAAPRAQVVIRPALARHGEPALGDEVVLVLPDEAPHLDAAAREDDAAAQVDAAALIDDAVALVDDALSPPALPFEEAPLRLPPLPQAAPVPHRVSAELAEQAAPPAGAWLAGGIPPAAAPPVPAVSSLGFEALLADEPSSLAHEALLSSAPPPLSHEALVSGESPARLPEAELSRDALVSPRPLISNEALLRAQVQFPEEAPRPSMPAPPPLEPPKTARARVRHWLARAFSKRSGRNTLTSLGDIVRAK